MAEKILVVADVKGGKLRKSSFEVTAQASRVAAGLSTEVTALVIGKGMEGAAAELAGYGAAEVLVAGGDVFDSYSSGAYTRAVLEACRQVSPKVIFLPASALGRDIASAVAAGLGAGMASDCTGCEVRDGKIELVRPIYAGKAYITFTLDADVQVITLRPNVFAPGEPDASRSVDVTSLEVGPDEKDQRAKVVEIIKGASEKPDLTEADIIVSGGRGMKGPEHWPVIEALAEALDAVLGASRAVVDSGWRPHSEQVGQTGKTVSPGLYVAVGISGAIQHLAGMRTSRCIVAINKDPEAPIFKIADYGIVGDLFDVVPALTEAVKGLEE
ncbi:MAG: electron transfer flavoprotein subunit alpha/FixB family protein [Planctomycetota bacterium]|nr:electron transfer flavoprotein subunit alpha/FixB family protein [Planctomycetota bacterium]